MKKVLVIQTAFIGDAILGTALLEKIWQDFPNAKIDYLVRDGNQSLFKAHPFLNEVLVWDKQISKYLGLFRMLQQIRSRNYDAVFNIQRYAASGILTAFSGAAIRVGYKENPLSFLFTKQIKHRFGKGFEKIHEVDRVLDLLQKEKTKRISPKLYPLDDDISTVKKFKTQPYITIAPASVWFTKQLPLEKWIELINNTPKNLQIFLIGGKSDKTITEEIKRKVQREIADLTGELKLLQTAALMQGAVMNYANDSAPVHLASAVNAPICEVFCSTIPDFGFTPLSSISHVVEVKEKLDCRPCGMHGSSTCPKGHFNCANNIDVNAMLAALD